MIFCVLLLVIVILLLPTEKLVFCREVRDGYLGNFYTGITSQDKEEQVSFGNSEQIAIIPDPFA